MMMIMGWERWAFGWCVGTSRGATWERSHNVIILGDEILIN